MAKKKTGLDADGQKELKETITSIVNLDDLKSENTESSKYKPVQLKAELFDRMKDAAREEDIPYMGRLVHRILESWLDAKGY